MVPVYCTCTWRGAITQWVVAGLSGAGIFLVAVIAAGAAGAAPWIAGTPR